MNHSRTKRKRIRDGEGSQNRKKQAEAYFTAEAAFVLPIIFAALLLMIYLFLYQYDRCLLEQDMGKLVLWGNTVPAGSAKEWQQQLEYRASAVYQDKYVAWETTDIHVELKRNQVLVKGKGMLHFPLPGWNIWNQENVWGVETTYRSERLSPVFFIRQYHKLKGERE